MGHRVAKNSLWFGYTAAIWLIIIGVADTCIAQKNFFKPVQQVEAFRRDFAEQSRKIETIISDFRQEKRLFALTESITSTGKFWFKRPNRVRIDYEKPFVYQMIMNGDKIRLQDNEKTNQVNLRSNRLFQQVNRIIVDCIQGTILDSKDFTARIFESEHHFLLEMTPAGKGLKDFFSTIEITISRSDYAVEIIEMNEPSGDKTVISFTNKVLNKAIEDEIFRF
jgi:outer membrane lipoprotein-sorting protein